MQPAMFHVKQQLYKMSEELLLPYTKFSKNRIQDILDVDPAQQSSQGMSRCPQLLRRKLFPLLYHRYAAPQRIRRLPQQFSLPLSANETGFARTKIVLRKIHQSCHQLLHPVAPTRRNREIRPALRSGTAGT